MLEIVSKGFQAARNLLKKESILNEHNIAQALNEVQLSLLEADVEYSVVKEFLENVKTRALGQSIKTAIKDKKGKTLKLSPHEHFINICHEELISLMSPGFSSLKLNHSPSTIMMVGLQGSGKTTSSAKLAKYLKEELSKAPMLVAADTNRPGAFLQLQVLGQKIEVPVFHEENKKALDICQNGLLSAKQNDVVIFDTAGRLALDEKLMVELLEIKNLIKPDYIFLVLDGMTGQSAVNTAKEFNNRLNLSGFILTKLDGDARGGAAISIKHVTNKPIFFIGTGEDIKSLEPFRPEGLASRILGMGDIVSLAKDFERHVSEEDAEKDMKRMLRGQFSFDDFLKQLKLVRKIGSFKSIIERIPFMESKLAGINIDEKQFNKFEAMVLSMTTKERSIPELLKKEKGRKERIAKGSGNNEKDVDQLVERFLAMRQMMNQVGKNPSAMMNMGSMMNPSMSPFQQNIGKVVKPIVSVKDKKDKRKSQKLARKKNKKR